MVSHRQRADEHEGLVLGMVGGLAVMTVAIVLTSLRGQLGPTNIALLLCIVVVGFASLGGRYAGVATGFVGALSFDFWHVVPYGTLRIDQAEDIAAVALLMVIGAMVGELSLLRQRSRTDQSITSALLADLLTIGHLNAIEASSDVVWQQIRSQLVDSLSLDDCRFEAPDAITRQLPRLDRTGDTPREFFRRFLGRGFELPPEGAEIVVQHGGVSFGRIVLVPGEGDGVTVSQRRVAVALAEQLGLALSRDRRVA